MDPAPQRARMRCGQDAARAARAGAELAGPVHPADDAAGGERVSGALDDGPLVELLDGLAVFARRLREFLRVHDRAPEGAVGDVAVRVAEIDAIRIERRAQRTA